MEWREGVGVGYVRDPNGTTLFLPPVGAWEHFPPDAGPYPEMYNQVPPTMVQIGPGTPPQVEYCVS